jgi:hypothetical protein
MRKTSIPTCTFSRVGQPAQAGGGNAGFVLEINMTCNLSKPNERAEIYTAELGQVFGRWKVVGQTRVSQSGVPAIMCYCDCGTERLVSIRRLNKGTSTSCGCLAAEKSAARLLTHGGSYTLEYSIWRGILRRCNNINCREYSYYGGRGIVICDEWLSFERFISDMGARSEKGLSIERRDNDGPYSKENCYWATYTQQNNKSQTTSAWAKEYGLNQSTLRERLKRGWSMEDALSIAVGSLTDMRNGGYKLLRQGSSND